MSCSLDVKIGSLRLKNPVIAGSGEHLIEASGVRRALAAGASVVVVKSTNEVVAAKDQLDRADYMVLDENWRRVAWSEDAPASATVACRSGLYPGRFQDWLQQTAALDREANACNAFVAASLILGDLDACESMARAVEHAGIRLLELNIGTPYASQATRGAVSTELLPARVSEIVGRIRAAVRLPLWVKVTGQSERVPELARAAFDAGADSVVMAGRLLGFLPDIDTLAPTLGTSLGVGGGWNLPLTCHWLATSRSALGTDRPLVGTNGAQCGADIARMMLAGASAVEMTSAIMLHGFDVIAHALTDLQAWLDLHELDARAVIGQAADKRRRFADMESRPGHWRTFVPREARG